MSTLGIRPARQLRAGNGIVINSGVISVSDNLNIETLKLNQDGLATETPLQLFGESNGNVLKVQNLTRPEY